VSCVYWPPVGQKLLVAIEAALSQNVVKSPGCVVDSRWVEINTAVGLSAQKLMGLGGGRRGDTLGTFLFPGSCCH
jgi:hypothetical protein